MLQKGGRGIKLDGTARDQTNTYLPLASIEFSISASVVFGVCSQIILWPPSGCTANLIGFSFSSEASSTSINSSSARFGTLAYRTLKVLSSIYGKFGKILIYEICIAIKYILRSKSKKFIPYLVVSLQSVSVWI